MNDAHYHLVVNHLPILFPLVGVIVLVIGFLTKNEVVKRTSYTIFILGAMAIFPSMSSGEGAEDFLESQKFDNFSHALIHEHEEKAEFFSWLSYFFGALSLVALWASWSRKKFAASMSYMVFVFAIVVLFFAKETGTSGGEISHPEIRQESKPGEGESKGNSNEPIEDWD